MCVEKGYTEFSFDFYSDFLTNLRLEAGASVIYGLIVNGLKDADAQASVTVE